jgi:16S rRNA processing protein RimM
MNINDYYKVGFVMRSHGLKGEVTLSLQTDAPVDWDGLTAVFLDRNGTLIPYFIETISVRGDRAFVKFEDVQSPEEANQLKGASIYLSKESRPKLARGEFYDEEVTGFEVLLEEELLGHVKEVETAGPNRFIIVTTKEKEVMIPVNGPFIKSINKSKKKITVSLPEGFLDI